MTPPLATAKDAATLLEDAAAMRFLHRPIVFVEPDRVVQPASWLDYTPFAFWIVDALSPSVLVELGCHSGNSYASFAQAVQHLGLPTACYAVDTWRGDAHAGFFDESVFEEWSSYHDRRFSTFSTLIRSTFDAARQYFGAGTIDLLHLDGYHTFDAVSHDFETWRPTLSDRAVVLCHDINVRDKDFGVWRLWERLRDEFPSFEFLHGHGLGVLGVGTNLPEAVDWLLSLRTQAPQQVDAVRRFFSRLGAAVAARHGGDAARHALTRELEDARAQLAGAAADIARLNGELADSNHRLTVATAAVDRLTREAADASARSAVSEASLSGLRESLKGAERDLAKRTSDNDSLSDSLRACYDELDRKANQLERFGSKIATLAHRVESLTYELDTRNADIVRLQRDRDRFPEAIAARDAIISALDGEAAAAIERLHQSRSHSRRRRDGAPRNDAYDTRRVFLSARSLAPDPADRPTIVVVSHAGAWKPKAGNEYRVRRMLQWYRSKNYRVIPVFAPLKGEELPAEAVEAMALEFGNAIQCRRDGHIDYVVQDAPDALRGLDGVVTPSFAALLGEERAATNARQQRLVEIERTFCHDVLAATIVHLSRALEPHVLQVEYIWMTRMLPLVRSRVLKVVDTHDVFSSVADKVGTFGIADVAVDSDEEAARLRRADLVIAIQDDERLALQRLVPTVPVITAAVDFDVARDMGSPVAGQILYVASDNTRNRKGLDDFLRLAWPRIHRTVRGAELIVAGGVGDILAGRDVAGVKVLGRVDDLAALYDSAALVINPAVAGTGLKIKILEALCHFRPVVTWPAGIEGLDRALAGLCVVAEDWYAFAEKVIAVLSGEPARRFTAKTRASIAERVNPESVYEALDAKYRAFFQRAGTGVADEPARTPGAKPVVHAGS